MRPRGWRRGAWVPPEECAVTAAFIAWAVGHYETEADRLRNLGQHPPGVPVQARRVMARLTNAGAHADGCAGATGKGPDVLPRPDAAWVGCREAAQVLGISGSAVRKRIASGQVPGAWQLRPGSEWIVPRWWVDHELDRRDEETERG